MNDISRIYNKGVMEMTATTTIIDEYVKEAATEVLCKRLKDPRPVGFKEKKSLQLRIAWLAAEKAEEAGYVLESLGPAIGAAWKLAKTPGTMVCPLPKPKKEEE